MNDPDIVGIAKLMDDAEIAEGIAIEKAYELAISQLSESERNRVADADPYAVSVRYLYHAGYAADVPDIAPSTFQVACERFRNNLLYGIAFRKAEGRIG